MIYFLVAWVSGAAGILVGMFLFALFHEREQMRWWRRPKYQWSVDMADDPDNERSVIAVMDVERRNRRANKPEYMPTAEIDVPGFKWVAKGEKGIGVSPVAIQADNSDIVRGKS